MTTSDLRQPAFSDDKERMITDMLFSGRLTPGEKITEVTLARSMGVSRIPAREMMSKLVARGVLVKDDKNRSVRLRSYSADEVSDLFIMREAIEVAAARLACRRAAHTDLMQMEVLCDLMEKEIGDAVSSRWSELDRQFHETLVQASHSDRLASGFDSLIRECHFVFYRHPAQWGSPLGAEPSVDSAAALSSRREEQMREIVAEHRQYLDFIRRKDADGVEGLIRERLQRLADNLVRIILARELTHPKPVGRKPRLRESEA